MLENWKDEKLQKWEIGRIVIEKIAMVSSIIKWESWKVLMMGGKFLFSLYEIT